MDVFYKVPRSNTARRILAYKDDKGESKIKELNKIIDKFWGIEGYDDYMATRFIELNHIDPNAFVVFEFKEFDNTKERLQPYPFEVFSPEAVDFSYSNRVLDYLIVKGAISLKKPITEKMGEESLIPDTTNYIKGEKYTLYTKIVGK